jgi:hypothetical protein
MKYQLVLAPDVNLSLAEVVNAWNTDAQAPYIAEAQMASAQVRPADPYLLNAQAVFTTTVATGVLVSVLTDVLKEVLERKYAQQQQRVQQPQLKVTARHHPDGSLLLVVEQEEEGNS